MKITADNIIIIPKILNSFKTIRVCTHYDVNGKKIKNMTEALNNLDIVKPIYKEFPGWNTEIENIDNFESLPESAQEYIKYLELEIGVKISIISIGPKRHQIILRNK